MIDKNILDKKEESLAMSNATLSVEALNLITVQDLDTIKKRSDFLSRVREKSDPEDYMTVAAIKKGIDIMNTNAISRNDDKVMKEVQKFVSSKVYVETYNKVV